MKKTIVCYKTIKPVVYNKGTKYETTCDTFLSYYTSKTIKEAQSDCDKINVEKPLYLWNGQKIDWNEIDYFYADEQEPFDD